MGSSSQQKTELDMARSRLAAANVKSTKKIIQIVFNQITERFSIGQPMTGGVDHASVGFSTVNIGFSMGI